MAAATLAWAPADAVESVVGRVAADKPAYTQTKTLTRTMVDPVEGDVEAEPNTMSVKVEETENLRGRQRVRVEWAGAPQSGGRTADPYGEKGMQQEYPVVIMQCRGVDDPAAPLAQQVRPETCWTSSVVQRSQINKDLHEATWTRDLHAGPEDTQRLSGIEPFPGLETCKDVAPDYYFTHLTPFVSKKGVVYPACDSAHMPPEAAVDSAFPPNEISAFSDEDGAGSVEFEVRSDVENESLGCNERTACAIVVVPIKGLSCVAPGDSTKLTDEACRLGGQFAPGSSNFAGVGVDQAVSPLLWWSESNWRNRFVVPITFGLPPSTCDIRDPRAPTGFYGSELLAQASIQWAPAYCLDKKRFKFQHNLMSDVAGFKFMEGGSGAAAIVSSEHKRTGDDPVGYAPTAVTGFGIGYAIDKPDNNGEYTNLRLSARLIAKLLTQSYLGSALGLGHPGISGNPIGLMNDPEFIALNPGLTRNSQEAGATLLSLSNDSDIVHQLTDYIAHDKDAMRWIGGKPDRWGMKVNPAYEKIELPREGWPLLDEYAPKTPDPCLQANPGVYFTQLAAPVTTLRKISEALIDAWPNVQTRCDADLTTGGWKLGRKDRQSYGSRFMLGLVSLGDAERYGLRTAALETTSKQYVEATTSSLRSALQLMEQKKKLAPFVLDQADVRKSRKAYPGTMVVYTAARLRNLPEEDAEKVALFMRTATTEGQREGFGNGELPGGFLPLRKSGATAALYRSAKEVADAVEAQKPASVRPAESASATPDDGASAPVVIPDAAPSAAEPSVSTAPTGVPDVPVAAAPVAMPATESISSRTASGVVPSLLIIGLVGIAIASLLRFLLQRPRLR
ncbi:hypothetical protein [Nocardioides sp. W7]|uniref:hypothetical protein n=1 Tax=Nocardioides sp. W7 TaxID=2931390 RepID=UPI001FD5A402|nr:hypothetical protein [Nocardioides sp. W7]